MSTPIFLPWQITLAQDWLRQRDRFSHAWLIHGLPGIGKRDFAVAAAASLLCEAPQNGLACGRCAACQWTAAGNHPDLRRIRPDAIALEEGAGDVADETDSAAAATGSAAAKKAPSKDIRIEQLRGLANWFNTATHRGGWRVAVLYPAQALNVISANALLKVLEEPPQHTIFLLVADAPDQLLPTLVSRCRRLPLPVPPTQQSLSWLAEQGVAAPETWLAAAGGAPVKALREAQQGGSACPAWLEQLLVPLSKGYAADVAALADLIEKLPAATWIDSLQRLFVDLMLAAAGAPVRYFPSLRTTIEATAHRAQLAKLAEASRWLTQQRALANHPLNAKLLTHTTLQRVVGACLS